MKFLKIIIVIFLITSAVAVFQNCGQFQRSPTGKLTYLPNTLNKGGTFSFRSLSGGDSSQLIDLSVYFNSKKIPSNSSRHSLFTILNEVNGTKVIQHSKFTQNNN